MEKLRKILVISVMMITVLSMCVVVAPQAGAAASAGSLIKMNGLSSVYFLAADGKRYVFPNESTYFSWYGDFSGVVTIPQTELESYNLGANVTVRPGTKLVKITTNPNVYAVTPNGMLIKVPSETIATTLWGTNWAKRVIDVPDAFFTNYRIDSVNVVSATAYPTGSLVKLAASPDVYYIAADGKAQKITSEAAFLANRFAWDNVITAAATFTLPTAGADITGAVATLTDTSSGAGGTIGAGTGLTIALSSDTPASASVPSYSSLVPFVTVNMTASNDGDVTVNDLTLTRFGTGATTDFDGGYLYDGLNRLTTKRSVSASDNTVTFNSIGMVISAGKTKSVTLRMDANRSAVKSGNHGFRIATASSVKTNGASVSGSFPVSGNIMTYSTTEAGTVTLTGGGSGGGNRKIGETNVILGQFDIANNDKEIVNIYHIKLKQDGDAGNSAVNNLNLDIDGTIVATGVSMVDRYVDFVLATPFELKKSKTVTATIRGDVITDINKTVQLYLSITPDFDARGTAYGDFYSVMVTNTSLDGTSADTFTIKGSEINVSFDGPQAQDVKNDTSNVVLANFKVLAQQDVSIETLTVTLNSSGVQTGLPMKNLEMADFANNLSFSVADPASSTAAALAFENIYLKKGIQYNFAIQGDIQDLVPAGAIYSASINFGTGFTARFQDANQTLVVTADLSQSTLTGKNMTVAAPSVSMAKVSINNATVVKDAKNVLLYKMKISATNVDDLKVSKLTFDGQVGQPATQAFSLDWNRLYLYADDGTNGGLGTKLDDETSLGVTSVAFTGFSLNVPKGLSNGVVVAVRGDVKGSPTGTTTKVLLKASTADQTVKDSKNNTLAAAQISIGSATVGPTITVATKGTYTLTVDTNDTGVNADQLVLAGGIRLAGRLKLTATNEPAKIVDLVLKNSGTAQNGTLAQLKLYSDKTLTTLIGTADVASGGTPSALFQNINYVVPTTGVTYLYIGAVVKAIDYSSSPSSDATGAAAGTIILTVPASTGAYVTKVTGDTTGETLADGFSGTSKTSTVMGAVISAMTSDFANGILADGAREIFSFKVTAPASGNIDYDGTALGVKLATTTFTYSTSSGITISNFKVYRVGGTGEISAINVLDDAAKTLKIGFQNTYGTNNDLIVRPGTTATYVLVATVAGTADNKSVSVSIENVDSGTLGVFFTHNQGTLGAQGSDTTQTTPLVSGLTSVRGGSLSK